MMKLLRRLLLLPLALGLLQLESCSGTAAAPAAATAVPSQWVVAWGASSQNALPSAQNAGGSEQSFRFMVYPSIGGTQERVHFTNYFGTGPITIGAARLAVAGNGPGSPAVDAGKDVALTFNSGSKSVTLQPKQEIDSDPVQVPYSFGQWLAVSMYLQGTFPSLTQHDAQFTQNYVSAKGSGDVTGDATGSSFTTTNTDWVILSGVETYGPYQGTVAVFGSSSVDGHASNTGNTNSYPTANVAVAGQTTDRPSDYLARSLNNAGYSFGVANAGLSGDSAAEGASTRAGLALAGIDRFQHDVLQLPGIKAVVIYIGGIDIRSDCLPATAVEGTLSGIVAQAASAGVRVVLATLPPSEYCQSAALVPSAASPYNGDLNPGPENGGSTQRRALNDWIRTSGAQLPGVVGIADFDKALASPDHPDFMIPGLNSGDNFHPNGAGYGVQNSAIPFAALAGH